MAASLNPSRMLLSLFWLSFIPILENGYLKPKPSRWPDPSQDPWLNPWLEEQPDEDPCWSCKRCKYCSRSCLDCHNCEEHFTITRSCALAMMIGAGVGVWFALPVLAVLGFTTAGVSVGSLAALWQSTMAGVIVKGGIFSILQSIGAAGFSYSGYVIVAGAAGAGMCNFCKQLGSIANMDMKCSSQINCDYYSDY